MNKIAFSNISQTLLVSKEEIAELERLCIEFPFCQSAHTLLAKAYHEHQDILSESKLRNAAVYAANRSVLKDIILYRKPIETTEEHDPVVDLQEPTPVETQAVEEPKTTEEENKTVSVETAAPTSEAVAAEPVAEPIQEDATTKAATPPPAIPVQKVELETPVEKPIESATTETELVDELKIDELEPVKVVSPQKNTNDKDSLHDELEKQLQALKNSKELLAEKAEEKPSKKEGTKTKRSVAKKSSNKKIEEIAQKAKLKASEAKPKAKSKAKAKEEPSPLYVPPIVNSRWGEVLETSDNNQEEDLGDINLVSSYLDYLKAKREKEFLNNEWQDSIIEDFIKKDPSISKPKDLPQSQTDLAKESVLPKAKLVTENMALIHARQGNYKKAIGIYEQLILKSPNKKAYFAAQIEKLKNQ